jgi:hypothetical protein
VSCGEENLLGYRGDSYSTENNDPAGAPAFEWEPALREARTKHYEKVKRDSAIERVGDASKSKE